MTPERRAAETVEDKQTRLSNEHYPRAAAKHRKRAERQRRREAGEVRVEVWLAGRDADDIRQMAKDANVTTSVVVTQLLRYYNS